MDFVYWHLIENADAEQRDELDEQLDAPTDRSDRSQRIADIRALQLAIR